MKIMDILVKDAVILDLGVAQQARRAGARWPRALAKAEPQSTPTGCSTCCSSARRSRAPASATASRSRTASCRASSAAGHASRAAARASTSSRSTASRRTSSSCWSCPEHSGGQHLKALARISRFFRDRGLPPGLAEGESARGRVPRDRGRGREVLSVARARLRRRWSHGALVEVDGVGVLLLGPSGIGKSECALELVTRGHRLVADDVVELRARGRAA